MTKVYYKEDVEIIAKKSYEMGLYNVWRENFEEFLKEQL